MIKSTKMTFRRIWRLVAGPATAATLTLVVVAAAPQLSLPAHAQR